MKAGIIACFFLLSTQGFSTDFTWTFDPELYKAYLYVVNLQPEKANEQLAKLTGKTSELHRMYVASLNETLEILISEDHKKFETIVDQNFKDRLAYLEKLPVSAETLFLQAELNLQRGFCLINLSQELTAVFAIRRAYNLTQECLKKYPSFIPIRKTNGTIQVMVGSVPDKFHWFMTLLGMKGSVVLGQKQLQELRSSKSSLSVEATILYFTVKGFINQQFTEAAKGINDCLKEQPDNRLLMFIGINMLVKEARSEEALKLISSLDVHNQGLPMYYIEYLRGEILLQKGEYAKSIQAYQKFIKAYRSSSFKKDSYFKISLCYWMLNNNTLAKENFEKAKVTGKDVAEPDKYAARQLEESSFPNKKLLKVRFCTDGGYYPEATDALKAIQSSDLVTYKDQTEYYYRKARLAHRTGDINSAKLFYQQSIDMTKDNPWYFGANAALQLGYIARDQKDYEKAKRYFELALTYKKHEYKSSIDGKAKSALEELKVTKGQPS